MYLRIMMAAAMTTALSGCVLDTDVDDVDGADAADVGETSAAILQENGKSLNGISLNGVSLNGKSLNGKSLNGISLNGKSLNGTSLGAMSLSASNFSGTVNSKAVTDWVGTTFTGTLSDASPITLRIDSKTTLPAPNADVSAYGVSYQTTTGWAPLCGVATTLAIPINGSFDYTTAAFTPSTTAFTFACRATAIAKCVELGYKPWKTVGGTLLQNHMVACTRMLRADFCGDGRSWTVNGTEINLYDGKGIQTDAAAWTIEAEWDQNGARRVNKSKDTRWSLNAGTPPACYTALIAKTTGSVANFAAGTLLMTEYKE
jgi:hypothetical protein